MNQKKMSTSLSKLGIDNLVSKYLKLEENNGDGRNDDKLYEIENKIKEIIKKENLTLYITGNVRKPISIKDVNNYVEILDALIHIKNCTLEDALVYEIQDYSDNYIDLDDVNLKIIDENNNEIAKL